MTKTSQTKLVTTVILASIILLIAAGDLQAKVELGRRYIDEMNGFSLRPPLDTERKRDPSTSRLVTWLKRDSKTGAIAWTLSVLRWTSSEKNLDLKAYSKVLARSLRSRENFKVDSTSVSPVGGKGAIHLSGHSSGALRMWQRQAWIYREDGNFLVIEVKGPLGNEIELNKLCQEVLETVELKDPKAAKAQRVDNLARGRELLQSITKEKIKESLITDPQWFLLRMKDKNIGFMLYQEKAATVDGVAGFEVYSRLMLQFSDDQPKMFKSRKLFSSSDSSYDKWSERQQVGSGKKALSVGEDGLRQDHMIVCNIANGGQVNTRKKPVPKTGIYIPRAMIEILPRLIDLDKPASYGFASYTTQFNDYDMLTFSVIGTEKLTFGDKEITVYTSSMQPNPTLEASKFWLTKKGMVLRMESPDGLVLQQATRDEILKVFPDAGAIGQMMGN